MEPIPLAKTSCYLTMSSEAVMDCIGERCSMYYECLDRRFEKILLIRNKLKHCGPFEKEILEQQMKDD